MTQLERVNKWLSTEWSVSIYALNEQGSRYYLYTFDKNNRTWEGMFWNYCKDDMSNKYRHVLDLHTMTLVR